MSQKKTKQSINGVLLLDKPVGISSSKASLTVKKYFNAAKAGHTGSLDVLASGLLPVCLGEATKFSQVLLDADKRYRTIAKLGERTTTCDAEGEITETGSLARITREKIDSVLEQFRGDIEQIPSMYSALKHQGKPLYELARQGIEVERKKRHVTIYELIIYPSLSISSASPLPPLSGEGWDGGDELHLEVHCSKGTYIRNLVDDIGQALDCGAHVHSLRRTATGPFNLDQAVTLEQLAEADEKERQSFLLPVDSLLQAFPAISLNKEQASRLRMGQVVDFLDDLHPNSPFFREREENLARAYHDNQLLGLVEVIAPNQLKPKRLLAQLPQATATGM